MFAKVYRDSLSQKVRLADKATQAELFLRSIVNANSNIMSS